MRKNRLELLAVALTALMSIGCVGYFVGSQNQGTVYEISVEQGTEQSTTQQNSDTTQGSATGTEESTAQLQTEEAADSSEELLVNINTATAEELQQLNGIGEVKAKAIVEYRTEHGDFTVVEELLKVSGIGEATLEKIIDYITVD